MTTQILTNATSGNSNEFQSPDGIIIFRLVINGTSSTQINAFTSLSSVSNNLYLKIKGLTGGGATIKIQSKTTHDNDDFSDTGQVWTRDFGGVFYYMNGNN